MLLQVQIILEPLIFTMCLIFVHSVAMYHWWWGGVNIICYRSFFSTTTAMEALNGASTIRKEPPRSTRNKPATTCKPPTTLLQPLLPMSFPPRECLIVLLYLNQVHIKHTYLWSFIRCCLMVGLSRFYTKFTNWNTLICYGRHTCFASKTHYNSTLTAADGQGSEFWTADVECLAMATTIRGNNIRSFLVCCIIALFFTR